MERDFLQKDVMTEQEGIASKCQRAGLDQIIGRISLLRGWWGTSTGCPEKFCWCLIPGDVQGWIGWSSEQPGLLKGVPINDRGLELHDPEGPFATQTTLQFYDFMIHTPHKHMHIYMYASLFYYRLSVPEVISCIFFLIPMQSRL